MATVILWKTKGLQSDSFEPFSGSWPSYKKGGQSGQEKSSTIDRSWWKSYAALVSYKSKVGHLNVKKEEDAALFAWCKAQKRNRTMLSRDKLAKLKSIGFAVATTSRRRKRAPQKKKAPTSEPTKLPTRRSSREQETFDALANEYEQLLRQERDSESVTIPVSSRLGQFVLQQQRLGNLGKLKLAHATRLISLGIVWEEADVVWNYYYTILLNNYNVVYEGQRLAEAPYEDRPGLSDWLEVQFLLVKKNMLSDERKKALYNLSRKAKVEEKHHDGRVFFKPTKGNIKIAYTDKPLMESESDLLCDEELPLENMDDSNYMKESPKITDASNNQYDTTCQNKAKESPFKPDNHQVPPLKKRRIRGRRMIWSTLLHPNFFYDE